MNQMEPYTVALTSCGRFDLLERTLSSLLPRLEGSIEKIIIVEDSANYDIFEVVRPFSRNLAEEGYLPSGIYTKGIEVIVNDPPIGQILSIDRLYSHVGTDWIFHCEDDWEFSGEGFIAKSFVLLKQFANFSMVGLRDEKDFRKPFCPEVFESSGVCYRIPDKLHPGMSFNPGLRRMYDYRIVGSYADLALRSRESIVAALYKNLGYTIAYLCKPATHHIGRDAHVSDQTRPNQFGPKLKQSVLKRFEKLYRKFDPNYYPLAWAKRRMQHGKANVTTIKG